MTKAVRMITYPSTLKYILTTHKHHFNGRLFVRCLMSSDKLNISSKFRIRLKQMGVTIFDFLILLYLKQQLVGITNPISYLYHFYKYTTVFSH